MPVAKEIHVTAHIEFPAISVNEHEAAVERIDGLKDFLQSTSLALRNRYYENAYLIDVRGNTFRTSNVRPARQGGFLSWFDRLANRRIMVSLDLEATGHLSLEAAQKRVCETIDKDPDLWSAVTGSHEDVKNRVLQSKSFDDLFGIFT